MLKEGLETKNDLIRMFSAFFVCLYNGQYKDN